MHFAQLPIRICRRHHWLSIGVSRAPTTLTADSLSGNAIASVLLGFAASGGIDFIARPYYRWRYYAPWVQDDIKLTRRLTVNLGLRWDLLVPLTERTTG